RPEVRKARRRARNPHSAGRGDGCRAASPAPLRPPPPRPLARPGLGHRPQRRLDRRRAQRGHSPGLGPASGTAYPSGRRPSPPGLVVTMRSMASGAMGPSADRAQGALREMAAALLSPDREMAAQSELATRAGGREIPAITPFLPAGTVPPTPRQPVAAVPAP